MTITSQLLSAITEARKGRSGYLCIDFKPDPEHGLGGTFVNPKRKDWETRFVPRSIWPLGKFRYAERVIEIGPRRNKQAITVLVSDAINDADIAELQRAYVDSL